MSERKRKVNRLLDRHSAPTKSRTIKCDERFEMVLERLMEAGYGTISEAIYDACFSRAMMANAIAHFQMELGAMRQAMSHSIKRSFRHSTHDKRSTVRGRAARSADGSDKQQRKEPARDR